MIPLIQLINYMVKEMHFTDAQITQCFTAIERRELTVRKLCNTLGVNFSPLSVVVATEKIEKWPQVLNFVHMRDDT
jgi:hypothetical protein